MVVQSAQEAIDNANAQTRCDAGMCLQVVRTWLQIPSREGTAYDGWLTAKHKHPGDTHPPDGAPAFWKSGPSGSGAGHITLVRKTDMRTTDKSSATYVSNDDGSWPRHAWGQSYLGWTEDLNGVDIPYLRGGGADWRASGDVYVDKLHKGQQDSDSVARLRYRLQNHAEMPDGHKPGYGNGYGEAVVDAVRYCVNNILAPDSKGPRDGSALSNDQANRLFGDKYDVIEEEGGGQDWRASGDVYVAKLHKGQQDSDSVARLRFRLQNHAEMPNAHKPGYGNGYGEAVVDAVRYCVTSILAPDSKGPRDGSAVSNDQANRLFGDQYHVIEE